MRWLVEKCALGLIAGLVVQTWLLAGMFVPVVVHGDSMSPGLEPGDWLLVDRTAFYFAAPHRWQMVVFRAPDDASTHCVKRVVGLPGEQVEIRDGRLWIDGQALDEDQVGGFQVGANPSGRHAFTPIGQPAQYQLNSGEYFMLGDNTAVSVDSRAWQPPGVPLASMMGVPIRAAKSH